MSFTNRTDLANYENRDPIGWLDNADIVVTYDSTARTITLTNAGGLDYYYNGVRRTKGTSWTSTAHSATTGNYYFLSIDSDGNSVWTTNASPGFDQLLVAYVYYGATDKFALREVHGLMPWQAHKVLHEALGTYRSSGGFVTAGSYALNTNSVVAVTPAVDAAAVVDEDVSTSIPAFTDGSTYTRLHFSSGLAVFTTGSTFPYPDNGTDIQYNQNPLSGTALTAITSNNTYVNVYGLFIPVTADAGSQAYRIVWMTGQTTYSTSAAAVAEQFSSLQLGNLASVSPEFLPFIRITYRRLNSNNTRNAQITVDPTYLTGTRGSTGGGSATSASGSDGAVQFATTSNFNSDASNFFWDNTNKRLGIGTNAPSRSIHTTGNIGLTGTDPTLVLNGTGYHAIQVKATDGATDQKTMEFLHHDNSFRMRFVNDAYTLESVWLQVFRETASHTAKTVAFTTGNVGIGTTTPGSRLSVFGTIESTSGGFKFPDATTQTTAILPGKVPANDTGDAISSSYIGHKIDGTILGPTLSVSGTNYDSATITLDKGVYLIFAKAFIGVSGTSLGTCQASISDTSVTTNLAGLARDSSDVNIGRYVNVFPYYLLNTSSSKTMYLVVSATFTGTSPVATAANTTFFAIKIG